MRIGSKTSCTKGGNHRKPYVLRGKTDAADAAAICEAMSRPGMRFVPARNANNQADLMLHKTRELVVKQRTMSVNNLRGQLAEFGIVAAKGIGRVEDLVGMAQRDPTLPKAAKMAIDIIIRQVEAQNAAIADFDREIVAAHTQNPTSLLLVGIPGIGPLAASLVVATVPDPQAFKSGRDFAAWLGLTPRLSNTGGNERRGTPITKQGDRRIRQLLVLGATAVLSMVAKRQGAMRDWVVELLARKPARLVSVALANKLARMLWAMMTTGEGFRREIFSRG